MKRKIININEDLCDGCGNCVVGCKEGALQIINGKAKLVKEDFCDGFGNCIGTCPTGALKIEEREAKDFDENAVKEHLLKTENKIKKAQQKRQEKTPENPCSCPGTITKIIGPLNSSDLPSKISFETAIASELRQWPVQLHLINPKAPYLNGKELCLLSTCSPIASADIHWKFIRGRSVAVACPKLDNATPYTEKLASIIKENNIPTIICIIMDVPCCNGLTEILKQAIALSENQKQKAELYILNLDGSIKEIRKLN